MDIYKYKLRRRQDCMYVNYKELYEMPVSLKSWFLSIAEIARKVPIEDSDDLWN